MRVCCCVSRDVVGGLAVSRPSLLGPHCPCSAWKSLRERGRAERSTDHPLVFRALSSPRSRAVPQLIVCLRELPELDRGTRVARRVGVVQPECTQTLSYTRQASWSLFE